MDFVNRDRRTESGSLWQTLRLRIKDGVCLWSLFAILLAHSLPLAGQDAPGDTLDFRWADLGFSVGSESWSGPWSRTWSPSPVLEGSLRAPFGLGMTSVDLTYRSAEARGDGAGFSALGARVEWGPGGQLGPLHWYIGAGLGTWAMRIDRELNRGEVEFTTGVSARLSAALVGGWRAAASVRSETLLSEPRLHTGRVSVGLERRFGVPSRLRRFAAGAPAEPADDAVAEDAVAEGADADDREPSRLFSRVDGRRTLDAEALRALGIRRMDELFMLLPGYRVTTLDRNRLRVGSLSAAAPMGTHGSILIDGVPADAPGITGTDLSRLRLHREGVDSVTVFERPVIRAGVVVQPGTVELHTRRRETPFEIEAWVLAAQPDGDGGPLVGRVDDAVNRDRLGLTGGFGVSSSSGPISFAAHKYEATWTQVGAMGARTGLLRPTVPGGKLPDVFDRAIRAVVSVETSDGRHTAQMNRGRRIGLPFVDALGSEVVATERDLHLGVSGSEAVSAGFDLVYAGRHQQERVVGDGNEGRSTVFGLESRTTDFALSLHRRGASLWSLGLAVGSIREDAGGALSEGRIVRANGSRRLEWGAAGPALEFTGSVGRVGEDASYQGGLTAEWILGRARLELTGTVAQRAPLELRSVWSRWSRGWTLPVDHGLQPTTSEDELPAERVLASELAVSSSSRNGEIRVALGVQSLRGRLVDDAEFELSRPLPAPTGPFEVAALSATTATLSVEAMHGRGPLTLWGWYSGLRTVDGAPGAETDFYSPAAHRASATAVLTLPSSLVLRALVTGRSQTRWRRYGPEGLTLPATVVATASLAKRFGVASQVELRIRNLFDEDAPLHPLGQRPGRVFELEGATRIGFGRGR